MAQLAYGSITITDTNDIESIIIEYAQNKSTSTAPTSGWSTNRPTWAQGYYIWQRTRIHKSGTEESTDIFGTAVCLTGSTGQQGIQGIQGPQGETGAAGRSLDSTETKYAQVTENSTETQVKALAEERWTVNVPAYNSSLPEYWVRVTNTYSNPTKTEKIYYKDQGLTDAVAKANDAWNKADSAQKDVENLSEQVELISEETALLGGHFIYNSTWQTTNTPHSANVVQTILKNGIDVSKDPTKWDYNVHIGANGIRLRNNESILSEWTSSALTFNNPSTGKAQLVIGANGTLQSGNYDRGDNDTFSAFGTKIDLTQGEIYSTYFRLSQGEQGKAPGAYISGQIEALSGNIGGSEDGNYWDIGDFVNFNNVSIGSLIGHGNSMIQLGQSSVWRLSNNRIHSGWYLEDDKYLHFPSFSGTNEYYDYGIHVPESTSQSFIYLRTANTTNNLSSLLTHLNDDIGTTQTPWTYKFYVDGNGNVHAPGFYIGDSTTPIGGGAGTTAQKIINSDNTYGKGSSKKPIYIDTSGYVQESNSDVGNATTPIYMSGGTLTALGYTIAKSVPSDAVFTDKKVRSTQANTTKLWLMGKDTAGDHTGELNYDSNVYLTTTAGILHATKFEGDLTGTAAKATSDSDGNPINTTYLKLSGGNVTGAVTFGSSVSADELTVGDLVVNGAASFTNNLQANTINGVSVGASPKFTDTTYTFANGTNGFTVTPSGGTVQTVTVTPSIANNVTGSGTSGYLAKFTGANTIGNGPALGSDTTKFLRNDGTWAAPSGGVSGVKGNSESSYRTGQVNITAANIGLGNVNNTSDADKPISTATQTALNNKQTIRVANATYNPVAGAYVGGSGTNTYARICLPSSIKTLWGMFFIEISIRGDWQNGKGGKVLINAYHNATSPYTWAAFNATVIGNLPSTLKVYGGEGQYFYIYFPYPYQTVSVDKILVGDAAASYDISSTTIDFVDSLPSSYQTATMYYSDNASTVNGHTVEVNVPSNAKFTDTWNALSTSQAGYVAQAPNDTSKFLRGDATWAAVTKSNVGLDKVLNEAQVTGIGSNNGKLRVYKGTNYEDVTVEIVATESTTATTATKLSSYGGASNKPVYIPSSGTNQGKPVAIDYEINKSVPANAVFTDTTYTAGSGLTLDGTQFKHSNSITAGTIADGGSTRTLGFGGTFKIPSITYDAQGHIKSTTTITLTMPAAPSSTATATSATNDSDGNKISTTYLKKSGGTMTGELIQQSGGIWIQGGSAAGGNSNRIVISAGMPSDFQYNAGKRGTRLYSNAIAFADPYNGNGNSDSGWIRHVEETTNNGFLEIAVGDDTNESIVVRQYNTNNVITREVYLLDSSGNTSFPGTVTAPTFNGNLNGKATSAGTADTANAVAWNNVTGKPINFITNSGALNTNGWKTLGGKTAQSSIAISYASSSAATWNSQPYSASIVFGCQDTKGLYDVGYSSPVVTFGGGSVSGSTDNAPNWYFKLSGTSGQTYTFPSSSKTLVATDGTGASGTWGISITGNAATASSATKATQDGSGNTITSTYVKKAGDSMTGGLAINASNSYSSYNEGLRINAGARTYATLTIGGTNGSTEGISDGAFWIGVYNTSSYARRLMIAHNGSTGTNTYFYSNAAGTVSPWLHLGNSGTITNGNSDAVTGGVVYNAISNLSGSYVTLNTDQTITASQKTFTGATRWGSASKYGAVHYDTSLEALVFSFA